MRVFISHSSIDKKFVRTLKDDLQQNGIETWLDEDELEFGDSLIEKLQNALEDSSHFILILSPTSVSSDWVRLELNNAKLLKTQDVLKKIIPIKYRECEIPDDLKDLLYGELASEVVITDNDKVKFVSDGYPKFFTKLIKTLKSSDKLLTKEDKLQFKTRNEDSVDTREIVKSDVKKVDLKNVASVKFYLKVIKFNSIENLTSWQKNVKSDSLIEKINGLPLNKIHPVILPSVLRLYRDNFKIGGDISFKLNNIFKYAGHFAGYKTKSDTYTIALPGTLRKYLSVENNKVYLFEFNFHSHEINVIFE